MKLQTFSQYSVTYSLDAVKADRELVKEVQANLTRIGFECGSPDGLWGRKTQAAFDAFVEQHLTSFTPAIAKLLIDLPSTPSRRQINQAGLALIKEFEGCRLEAYRCPAGVATIGYGSTQGVKMGMKINQNQAESLLRQDLERFERGIELAVNVPLSDNQFGALVSFAFNVGINAFSRSTLLKVLNQGYYRTAADQFTFWDKADGRVLPGLTRRRQAERTLFLRP